MTAVRCSFCEKAQDEVERLIAGPSGVFICDECVDLCKEILDDGQPQLIFTTDRSATPDAALISRDLGILERRLTASVVLLTQLKDRIEGDHTD